LSGEPLPTDVRQARSYSEASLLAERGREEEATVNLRALLSEAPDEILPRLLLAELALRAGEKDAARRLAEPVSGAPARALTRSAVLFLYLGEEARAEELLREACRRDRRSAEPLLLLARLRETKGDAREAKLLEKRASEIDPNAVQAARAERNRS
jgi:Tfp pilus assembly protein PilF